MLTIIGCGNPTRSDDGLGPFVAARLRDHVATLGRDDVRVFDAGTDGMSVMFSARGSETLVIVDAARTGAEPGAIYDVPGDILARAYEASLNLHDFRWEHALAAGRQIYARDFPKNVRVLLVQVEGTDFGLELSDAVRAAAERIVTQLRSLIAAYAAPVAVAALA